MSVPPEFSWSKIDEAEAVRVNVPFAGAGRYVAPRFDQHQKRWCGACFLVATAQMLEDRLHISRCRQARRALKRKVFDLQSLLDQHNQYVTETATYNSCHGGYATDVVKCIQDKACRVYATESQDSWLGFVQRVFRAPPKLHEVSLEITNMRHIPRSEVQRELMTSGTVLLYINAKVVASTNDQGIMTDLDGLPEENHAVSVVGWTHVDMHLHWIVRNSWGDQKPENLPKGYQTCNVLGSNRCEVAYEKWNSIRAGHMKGFCLLPDRFEPLQVEYAQQSPWFCADVS